jgi:hypothetical protein
MLTSSNFPVITQAMASHCPGDSSATVTQKSAHLEEAKALGGCAFALIEAFNSRGAA